MIESRQDLPLLAEPGDDVIGRESGVNELDGDFLSVFAVIANRQVNCGHSAPADLTYEPVWPDLQRATALDAATVDPGHPAGQRWWFQETIRLLGDE